MSSGWRDHVWRWTDAAARELSKLDRLGSAEIGLEDLANTPIGEVLVWCGGQPDRVETADDQVRADAVVVICAAWRTLRYAQQGDLERFGDALADFSDAAEWLRMSVNHPHRQGWLRETSIIEGDRLGARVERNQDHASKAGNAANRERGEPIRLAIIEAYARAAREGRDAPSSAQLARRLRRDSSTVREHVRKLKEAGRLPR